MALTLEQKLFRQRGISASDIGRLGIKIWEQKVSPPSKDQEVTVDMERGNELESALLRWTGHRTKSLIFHNSGPEAITFQSPEHEIALATPDGLIFQDFIPKSFEELKLVANQAVAVVEVKSPGPYTLDDWAHPVEVPDGIPSYYLPQVQWQMGVLQKDYAIVGALVGRDLQVYRVAFDLAFFKKLLTWAKEFWSYVEMRKQPPVDGTEDYAKYLVKKYPSHTDNEIRQSTPEIDPIVRKLQKSKGYIKDLEQITNQCENEIKDFIGDASGIIGPWGKISWRKSKDRSSWDTKAMVAWFKENQPDMLAQFNKVTTGPRIFRPTFKNVQEES